MLFMYHNASDALLACRWICDVSHIV